MKEPTDYQVTETMKTSGGSFARQLAVLWRHADPDNRTRIQTTWEDVWQRYAAIARDQVNDQP